MQITDTITGQMVTVEHADQIAQAIKPWFPQAPSTVYESIDDLQVVAMRGDYTGDHETYLAIRIER
jgi:hypothetical protein